MMEKKIEKFIWLLVENIPSVLTVTFAAYVLVQSQRTTLQEMEVLLWLLGIVGLLATSELVERFGRLRRIELGSLKTLRAVEAILTPDAENILRDRRGVIDLSEGGSQAREIWACGYSLINLLSTCEGFFVTRLKDGCNLRFLLLSPKSDATRALDTLVSSRPGELIEDIKSSLARLERIRTSANSKEVGLLEVHLLKVVPTYSLIVVDPGKPQGYVHVEPYPSYYGLPLDVGRPHFTLTQSEGRWYRFFCNQFELIWNNPKHSEPLKPNTPSNR
jgi:hypothetical protein